MGELVDLAPFVQLGAAGILLGIVAWVLRTLARGDWVSRRELDYVRSDRDARIAEKTAEADHYRAAHETSEHARELLNQQNRDLIAGFRTLDQFFTALRALAERDRDVE